MGKEDDGQAGWNGSGMTRDQHGKRYSILILHILEQVTKVTTGWAG